MTGIVESSGTATSIIGSPVTLAAPTNNHVRAVAVDLTNLAAGEVIQISALAPLKLGGTSILIEQQSFTGVAPKPNAQIIACLMPYGGSFTINQTSGSVRTYDWFIEVFDP